MALSTRKKNQIIADWKAGRFTTYYAIAKHYQISNPTAKEILVNIPQSNADIVEAGVTYEKAKKLNKNLIEVKAIEALVKERTIADEIQDVALSGTLANLKSVKSKIEKEEIETIREHRHAQELFDKALITADKADRHAKSGDINVQANSTAIAQTKKTLNDFYDETIS
jgi:hypothetical protein